MGAHARPTSRLTRRIGRISLAVGSIAILGAGIWVLGSNGSPAETTITVAPAPIGPTSTVPSTTATDPGPVLRPYGGEVVVGISTEPITLNPFLEGGGAEVVHLVGRTVWAGAIGLDGITHDPVPVLIDEIPTVDNGGLVANDDGTATVTYTIRPEAAWEDGSPVTGADFEFTYNLITDPLLPIRADVREPYLSIVPGSLQVTETTVMFDLTVPSLGYLDVFSIVTPMEQVAETDFATDWNQTLWMSAGPFRFEVWNAGNSINVTRNDAYWGVDPGTGQDLPYLDRLVFEIATAPGGIVTEFQAGRVDVVNLPNDPGLIVETQTLAGVEVQVEPGLTWEHLSFQFDPGRLERNPDSLNEHVEYRRAIAHALDRRLISDVVSGGLLEALDSPLGVVWPAAASSGWSAYRGETDIATAALEDLRDIVELDIPRAVFTTNNTPERSMTSDELGAMFAGAGIALEIEPPEDTGVFFLETVGPGVFDLAEWAWVPKAGPAGAVADVRRWFLLTPEEGGSNFSRWPGAATDPSDRMGELAGLLDDIATELDLEQVKAMLGEIEVLMADLVVTVPLYAELDAGAVRSEVVSGYRHSVIPGGDTWNAGTWFRTDG